MKKKIIIIISVVLVVLLVGISVGTFFIINGKNKDYDIKITEHDKLVTIVSADEKEVIVKSLDFSQNQKYHYEYDEKVEIFEYNEYSTMENEKETINSKDIKKLKMKEFLSKAKEENQNIYIWLNDTGKITQIVFYIKHITYS